MTTGRLLARNSAITLLGQAVPLIAAVVAIPPLVRGLGDARFGILTLAWAALGYFSLFEFGLGKALTQATAARLANGSVDDLPELTRTALTLLLALGAAGGLLLAALTPLLTNQVLSIPEELRREAAHSFWILAAALPFVVSSVGLRGLLEAHQHFGLATLLRIPMAALTFIGPLLLLPFSKSVVPAVAVLGIGRAATFALHLWVCTRLYGFMREPASFSRERAAPLLHFGGWSTVSNIVSPLMVYLDRFFIGSLLTVAAVAHYVTPYEIVVKILIVPVSLTTVLLPAMASMLAADGESAQRLYDRAFRAILLATFPIVLVAIVFANEGLFLWMGDTLPRESATIVQWLTAGVFVAALAQAPLTALQAAARTDLIAKLHLAELPLYGASLVVLAKAFGIVGVAMAWTIRGLIDAAALFWIAHRRLPVGLAPRNNGGALFLTSLVLLAGATLPSTRLRVVFFVVCLALYVAWGWSSVLRPGERESLQALMRSFGRKDGAMEADRS